MATSSSTAPAAPAAKRDRTHYLYIAVIAAVAAGIAVGLIAPDFAVELKPIGTGFVNLIKMMISPIIFCTIVLGIGSVRKAAKVGKVGGIALGYFVLMSFVALGIGLVVGNIIEPGTGLALTDAVKETGQAQVAAEAKDTTEFLLGIIPTTFVSAFTGGRSSRRCSSPCSPGSRSRPWARPARRSCAVSSTSSGSSSASSAWSCGPPPSARSVPWPR